ncbi:MAG: hypothetical protein RR297_03155 [Clostridia bacterium]
MPNISGFVYYDPTFASVPGTGIPNVPVALYNIGTGRGAVALTNAAGAYLFTNVPAGNYAIIETWGTAGSPTPIDFTAINVPMVEPPEIEPPLSAVPAVVPALADLLNALSPNFLKVMMAATNLTNQNFYDAPIGNKPLAFSGITFAGSNLITAATNGTWGTFPAGQAVMTTNPTDPYPGVTPGFTYIASPVPIDGQFTVMNTRTFSYYPWWPVSDHTSRVETGRYLVINGANPGSVVFTQPVTVLPNTQYVLTSWILNLIDMTVGFVDPQLALQVLGSDGSVIYLQQVNQITGKNVPIWYQDGFLFNTGSYHSITVQIINKGPAAHGNDYLIDDVALYQVQIQNLLTIRKTAAPAVIYAGSDVTFTAVIVNNSAVSTLASVFFKDVLDPTLVFTPGSITVNGSGVGYGAADPTVGFSVGNIAPGATITVVFHAVATAGPSPVKNVATGTYPILVSGNGDVVTHTVPSNPVFLRRPLHDFGQQSTDLAESTAYEQAALAHILNAEGEKIQQMLTIPGVTPAQLLAVNASVQNIVDSVGSLECIMKQKLQSVKNQLVGYKTI